MSSTKDGSLPLKGSAAESSVRTRQKRASGNTSSQTLNAKAKEADLADKRELALARRRQNMLSGPCRLPPEILAMVFEFAQDGWWKTGEHCRGAFRDLLWIYLTHVCGYWREVALNTAILWTSVDCFDIPSQFTTVVKERSRNLPLSLDFSDRYSLLPNFPHQWLGRAFRSQIKHLHLQLIPSNYDDAEPYLEHSMTSLETLTVDLDDPMGEAGLVLSRRFCRQAPLTKLILHNCAVHWNHPWLGAKLTVLSLSCGNWGSSEKLLPSLEELSSVLSRLVSLEELHLSDIFPIDLQPADSPSITVAHTCMRLMLYGSERNEEALNLLTHLSIPEGCFVFTEARLSEESSESTFEALDFAMNALYTPSPGRRTHFPQEVLVCMYQLSFHDAEFPQSEWTTSMHERLDEHPERPGSRYLTLDMDMHSAPEDRLAFCTRFLKLSLQHIRAISFSHYASSAITRASLWPKLSGATDVHRLGFDIGGGTELLHALAEVHEHECDRIFALLPRLETIHIHSGVKPSQRHVSQIQRQPEEEIALVVLVRARSVHGAPIRELVVEQSLCEWESWASFGGLCSVSFQGFDGCRPYIS